MRSLTWWFRMVGAIYMLLGLGFLPALNAARLPQLLPGFDAPIDGVAFRALLDYTLMFGLDLFVIGAFLLGAARAPQRYVPVVWLVLALELVRGIFDDVYMLARGYAAPIYFGFIVLHVIIIITGIVSVRQARAEEDGDTALDAARAAMA